jgi:peptidoglycan DL-endopeptidase LytE
MMSGVSLSPSKFTNAEKRLMRRNLTNGNFVCAVILTLIFYLLTFTLAEANTHYKVRKGDNLAKIAKKFRVPVDELKAANHLESGDLSIGRKLVIPKKASAKAKKTKNHSKTAQVAKAEKTEKAEQPAEVNEKQQSANSDADTPAILENKYHTVQKKDTISKIARRYGLSAAELKELNNLSSNRLKAGRKLIVGKSRADDDKTPNVSAQGNRINVSEKIAEVKALSQSDELSNLSVNERLILFAKKMINLPYKFGGNGTFALDCSSFVQKVYGFVGHTLPRSAREQYTVGEAIDKDDLQSGDLLFFRTYASFPSHVGIYIGNNLFIHASYRSKKVMIENLDTPYYVKRFIGAKRLLPATESDTGNPGAAAEELNP